MLLLSHFSHVWLLATPWTAAYQAPPSMGFSTQEYWSGWRWWNSSWALSNPERWCCESVALNMPANLKNSAVATGLEKVSFIPVPKKGNAIECSNYHTIALISHASKAMLKILQARLQQYMNHELPDVQAGFRKGRGTRDQIANICGSCKKQESSRKTSISALLTMPKPLTVWITINCGKFWKRWESQTTWPPSWEICMQVRKQELELYMEQRLVPNRKRSTSRLYIVTLFI